MSTGTWTQSYETEYEEYVYKPKNFTERRRGKSSLGRMFQIIPKENYKENLLEIVRRNFVIKYLLKHIDEGEPG